MAAVDVISCLQRDMEPQTLLTCLGTPPSLEPGRRGTWQAVLVMVTRLPFGWRCFVAVPEQTPVLLWEQKDRSLWLCLPRCDLDKMPSSPSLGVSSLKWVNSAAEPTGPPPLQVTPGSGGHAVHTY